MNKALLLFCLFLFLNTTSSVAQVCERDSNLLLTNELFSPAPYTPDSPYYNLAVACIEDPYNESVTVFVPDTFLYQNIFKVPIQNVSIPVMGAISNYPAGMTYSCDPPNCVFLPLTLGCIRMHGTPNISNQPDTFDLGITAKVKTILGEIPISFPGEAAPGSHYYLILNAAGACVSNATDPGSPFSSMRAIPNPVSGQTTIEVLSTQDGLFQFEVFDLMGKRIHLQKIQLNEGENKFFFDAAALPNGTYLYAVGNASGKSVRRMVKM